MSTIAEKEDLTLKYIALFNESREKIFKASSAVLNKHRQRAFLDFMDQGIPTRKNENYKYTSLQPAFSADYTFHPDSSHDLPAGLSPTNSDLALPEALRITILNGKYAGNAQSGTLPAGIILDNLKKVAIDKPALVEKYYGALADTKEESLAALNTAFATDGFFLYIPDNTNFPVPLQIDVLLGSEKDAFVSPRNLIIAGANSSLTLLVYNRTLNRNQYLTNSVTELFAGANARISYVWLQNHHEKSVSLNSLYIQQERDSQVNTLSAPLQGGLVRNNLWVKLSGENADANLFGMSFPVHKQHTDHFTYIEHASPHCTSRQLYKNILDDESTGVFSGRIHVVRDAQKTNAFQRNNNLVLTDKAAMHTKPQLIIEADDVKCSHGATVGQIDQNALFYLRSRGIPDEVARLMMVNAFAHEVIQELPLDSLREQVEVLVEKRLRGELDGYRDTSSNDNFRE